MTDADRKNWLNRSVAIATLLGAAVAAFAAGARVYAQVQAVPTLQRDVSELKRVNPPILYLTCALAERTKPPIPLPEICSTALANPK